jgi:hypothetical protein
MLWLARLPCLPSETTPAVPEVEAPAPAPAPTPSPAPRPKETPPAPVLPNETATYRVTYSIFGEVAQATVTFTPARADSAPGTDPVSLVRAVGSGSGDVLGFGKTDKRIESEFDARALGSKRWTSTRRNDGKIVVDIAEQPQPGAVSVVRKREGQPDQTGSFSRQTVVLDPLGLLLRIRMDVPTKPTVYEVLDGRGLWLISLTPVAPGPGVQPLLRLDGHAAPIYWNGEQDKERTARKFTMYLSNDARHIPVRLVIPLGIGEVRAEIVTLSRPVAGTG